MTRPEQAGDPIAVDAKSVQQVLDGHYGWARDEVRAALSEPEFARPIEETREQARDRVLRQMTSLAKTQGPKLLFPREYGGLEDLGAAITAFETTAFGDLSLLVKSGVQWGLFGGAIRHLGTERHHEKYLPDVISFALPGCFAMTETGHGSDVQSIRTTATYDETTHEFVITTPDDDARKDYIGNAARDGRMAAVFAQLCTKDECHGVHCLLVPIRDEQGKLLPGVEAEDDGPKMGLNGVDNGRLRFTDVRVPRENLLDRYGSVAEDGTYSSPIENETRRFFTMLGTLVQGRISISSAAVSAAKSALTIAVRYGSARRQFKDPGAETEVRILDFLAHQRRLLPLLATTYALSFAQSALIAELDSVFADPDGDDTRRRKLETLAAGMKATTTWHATRSIQTAREACGGAGYLAISRLPQLKADSDIFTTFEGDNTVLMQLVAKTLLTDYRDEFGELDTFGVARFLAEQVVETVLEKTSVRTIMQRLRDAVPGNDEETDLRDRTFQRALFEWRERHVLEGVANRLRKGISAGEAAFDVFNSAQDHVLLAAHAHMDRIVMDRLAEAVEAVQDPEVKRLLDLVCDLHALSTIERERAWFMEHGQLTPARSKAVTAAVNAACEELRPYAELLVDAFAIPEALLLSELPEAEARRQAEKAELASA